MKISLHFVDGRDRAINLRQTQSSAAMTNSFGAVSWESMWEPALM
jgi:hypothetical protein